jgi:cell division protease FtsH
LNNLIKNMAIWLVIALVLMTVFNQFSVRQPAQVPIEYSQFISELNQGRIAKVIIEGRTLRGIKSDGRRFTTYAPSDPWLVSDLLKSGVVIVEARPEEEPSILMSIFISWFPMLLIDCSMDFFHAANAGRW